MLSISDVVDYRRHNHCDFGHHSGGRLLNHKEYEILVFSIVHAGTLQLQAGSLKMDHVRSKHDTHTFIYLLLDT